MLRKGLDLRLAKLMCLLLKEQLIQNTIKLFLNYSYLSVQVIKIWFASKAWRDQLSLINSSSKFGLLKNIRSGVVKILQSTGQGRWRSLLGSL